jgi:voltage-gated sodium channel
MLTLFSVLTLEGWPDIQKAALAIHSWAWIYFVSFVLLSSFVLANMLIAVVINSVEDARAAVAAEDRKQALREEEREEEILRHVRELRETVEALENRLSTRT